MSIAEIKRNIRAWLSGRPWLLQAVFWALGKPYMEIAIFRSLIRPGDTVLDLGANTGQYTSLFCTLAGPSGAVHAFEPVPPTFAILKKNLDWYSKKYHLFLNDFAVGDSEGVVTMFVADGRLTEASMVQRSAQFAGGEHPRMVSYDCRVTTVDRYINENNVQKVDAIKCDVEGAELLAIRGAKTLLKSKHPPILFLEAWSDWTKDFGYTPAELFEFLEREAGYAIYHVYRGGMKRISPREALPPDSFPNFLNFLCVVLSVHGDRLQMLQSAGIDMIKT